ncbi:unnamed protein product [Meloidogyne enterolobii]|uniref:Uncharacterized protein n=1 Tax=Meloidogyne enterolobii TaxID=390850 RepID=A0ACB1AT19_MELEN
MSFKNACFLFFIFENLPTFFHPVIFLPAFCLISHFGYTTLFNSSCCLSSILRLTQSKTTFI